jgi:hypothetical protein
MKRLFLIAALITCGHTAFCQETLYKINDNVTRERQYEGSHRNKQLDKFALMDRPTASVNVGNDMILRKQYYQGIDCIHEQIIFRKGKYKYGIFLLHDPAVKKNLQGHSYLN